MPNKEDVEIVRTGGSEDRSSDVRFKTKKQFPTDYTDFYPKKTDKEVIDKAMRLVEQKRRVKIPKQVQNVEVLVELVTVAGRAMTRLVTTFQQDNDPNFFGAYLWLKGYQTDNALADYDENANNDPNTLGATDTIPFQRQATLTRSPSTIYLENTAETIIVGVEAFNQEGIGAGIFDMPFQTVDLL